jgi:hypothetical protein
VSGPENSDDLTPLVELIGADIRELRERIERLTDQVGYWALRVVTLEEQRDYLPHDKTTVNVPSGAQQVTVRIGAVPDGPWRVDRSSMLPVAPWRVSRSAARRGVWAWEEASCRPWTRRRRRAASGAVRYPSPRRPD